MTASTARPNDIGSAMAEKNGHKPSAWVKNSTKTAQASDDLVTNDDNDTGYTEYKNSMFPGVTTAVGLVESIVERHVFTPT